tara:strand:+ start:309 stop:1151 length:843 start_codon:yes stop_codon:yes gene_type:complete
MKTYKEHFIECRQNYNDISETDENYLYDFSLAVVDDESTWLSLGSDYAACVARIKGDLEKRFTVRNECWYPPGLPEEKDFATRIKNIWNIDGLESLCDILIPQIESKIFGSHALVEAVYAYRNSYKDSGERSSWIWHWDNHPKETIKIMIYLTDVSESTGAFEVLQNNEGHTVRAETSRIDHETWTSTDSRVPENFLNVLKQQGFTPSKIIGKTGTICIFDNNIIHKASIPDPGNYRDAIVLMVRPTKEKTRPFIDKNNTGTFYHVDLHVNPEHLGVQKK